MAQRQKKRRKGESKNGFLDLFAGTPPQDWVAIPKSVSEARPFVSILDLRRIVGLISDKIFAAHGHDRLRLFDTLLILLATKIYDELHSPEALRLSAFLSAEGNLLERVQEYAHEALAALNCEEFPSEIDLMEDALRETLALLGRYSLVNTLKIDPQAEVLGTFYQEVVSSTFRGSLGAYFTPKPVADLAAAFCRPVPSDTIFDISCGSATFLLSAYRASRPAAGAIGPAVYGNDIQERMVLTSALNCTLHQVKNAYFTHNDGLKIDLKAWHSQNRAVPKEGFSLIVGNPPFAGFEALVSGESDDGNGKATRPRLHKIIPFIRKVVDLLAPDGRAALVVPTSVLNAEAVSFRELRNNLARAVTVTALVNLPRDAFVHTDCGVEGALLFFTKRAPYPNERTFFGTVRALGYDSRGHRNEHNTGEELLAAWERNAPKETCWIPTQELYQLERWDVPWLRARTSGMLRFSEKTHLRLTDLCSVVRRTFPRRTIEMGKEYTYFEVGDTDIDHGIVKQIHRCTGEEILRKGRLKLRVQAGDVLLPNHRDSLIAKTAAGVGRSAVRIGEQLEGCITTDRFTPLEAKIDPDLLIAILNSGLVRRQLEVHARGSASFDIRDKVLEEVWVPRSLVDTQTAKRLNKLFRIRERLRKRLEMTARNIEALIDDYPS